MGHEYLLEIRSLDMPPDEVENALKRIGGRLFEELMGSGLAPGEIVTGATPRRLMVCCLDLPESEVDREEQELGPSAEDAWEDDKPTAALLGFAERVGCDPAEISVLKTERGDYAGIVRRVPGRVARDVLAEKLPRLLAEVPWTSRARWREGDLWVRPVRSVLSLFDGKILPLDLGPHEAGDLTAGHPVLSPEPFAVKSFTHYVAELADRGIEVSWRRRAEQLGKGLEERAQELKGQLEIGDDQLFRLAGRCEIPGTLGGGFDPDHLSLPEEILCATLEGHLASPLRNKDGELLPLFVTAVDRADDPDGVVRAGHERALSGHLADARFHYDADRARTMVERARELDQHTFHPGLGTWAEKTERLLALAQLIARESGLEEHIEAIQQAAQLLKADLTTDTMRRLPQLRGTLGGIHARREGYMEAVWRAISEHYQPGSSTAPIPSQSTGQVLALADRLDTLVGFLGLGLLPQGRKDPYALRRLVRGLLRILIEGGFELDLDLVGARAVLLYGDALERGAEEILTDLQGFLSARLEHLLGQRGFTFDEIAAARAVGHSNLPDLVARIEALRTVREEADFRSLVLAAKRISNLVDGLGDEPFDETLLSVDAERELAEALDGVREKVDQAVAERRYADGLRHIEALVPALDRFFAEVLVMDENASRRTNRIALLQRCRRTFWRVARLKEMVIDRESPSPSSDAGAVEPTDPERD